MANTSSFSLPALTVPFFLLYVLSIEVVSSLLWIDWIIVCFLALCSYYFNGKTSKLSDYLDPAQFDGYAQRITDVRNVIKNTSNPNLPYWNGETADAYNNGTEGVSDRFAGCFLWVHFGYFVVVASSVTNFTEQMQKYSTGFLAGRVWKLVTYKDSKVEQLDATPCLLNTSVWQIAFRNWKLVG